MRFEKTVSTPEKMGTMVGYVFAYILFTTMLYFMLTLLDKLPASWNYLYIMGITSIIALLGIGIKRGLSIK